jgi:hypothetical protein
VPGVRVAEMVDVGVKNDLVRAHVVALKDDCESVVLRVESLVSPVGFDRRSRGRESATRAADAARGVRAGGRTRTRRPRCLATCITSASGAPVSIGADPGHGLPEQDPRTKTVANVTK